MNKLCCPNCFTEPTISRHISESGTLGKTCNYCESDNQKTICVDEITGFIEQIIEGLTSKQSQELSHDNVEKIALFDILLKKLCFFGDGVLDPRNLLIDILSTQTDVVSAEFFLPKLDVVKEKWSIFSTELKQKNRFFPNSELYKQIFNNQKNAQDLGSNAFHTLVELLTKEYSMNRLFYRARVSSDRLSVDQMGAPPAINVTAGRANPVGIPYLYLADNNDTCIAEVRPHNGALVSIAAFKLSKNLKVLDLTSPRKKASFLIQDNLVDTLKYIDLLDVFSEELSKPVQPNRTHLDYIPTQYLCEYFKSVCRFDGLIFNSSFGMGTNLVLFDEENVIPVEMKYYRISATSHKYDECSI